MPVRDCVYCGKEFYANTCGKLCSDECRIKHNQKEQLSYKSRNKEKISSYFATRHKNRYTPKGGFSEDSSCSYCKSRFVKSTHNGAYCSKDCAMKSKKEQRKSSRPSYDKICEVCSIHFETTNKRTVCCSEVCRHDKIKSSKRINLTAICSVCSNDFNKISTSKTCSLECSRIHRLNNKKASNKMDFVRDRENKRRRENPRWGVKGELKRKLGFSPDEELIDLAVIRLEMRRAIRKARE